MKKLNESLIILLHFGLKNKMIYEICKKYAVKTKSFRRDVIVIKRLQDLKKHEIELNLEENLEVKLEYVEHLYKEADEIMNLVRQNISQGIIDMYSFLNEYNSFFNSNISQDEKVKDKIINFKKNNKVFINSIDWEKIKLYRNTVLAHNLRVKKEKNLIAFNNLTSFNELANDYEKCSDYFHKINVVYNNLIEFFEYEISESIKELND